ncbi:MAG: thioredoxin family protein [Candidatus Sericytochromatia bacterium]|nr:thioredoxin family protein [Candidatus Sericytochromatia bacterium]
MKQIAVLGMGCAKCKQTAQMITDMAQSMGVGAQVEKDTSMESLLKYQVLSTPGVVVDGKLVHSGGLPRREQVEAWLKHQ